MEEAKYLVDNRNNYYPDVWEGMMEEALLGAAAEKDFETFEYLYDNDANANLDIWLNREFLPCVTILEYIEDLEPQKFINDDGNTFLSLACLRGHMDEIQWLLEHNSTLYMPNHVIRDIFIEQHDTRIPHMLLERGIDMNSEKRYRADETVLDHLLASKREYLSESNDELVEVVEKMIQIIIPYGAELHSEEDDELQRQIDAVRLTKHKLASLV